MSENQSELLYLDIQALIGTTKHMGGLETTQSLIDLCHIGEGSYVLDVGCGVGATACTLAEKYGCRVVGVDLREAMIERANDRARRNGVEDRVEFRVADAQDLPFEDGTFDVLLCESVITFVEDKRRALGEYARVVRPGGYVGLNEEIWLETPTAEVVQCVREVWDIVADLPTVEDWVEGLEEAGFEVLVAERHKVDLRRESSQVKRYRFRDLAGMLWRTLSLYVRRPDFRAYMRGRRLPKSTFKYLGYALLVGRRVE